MNFLDFKWTHNPSKFSVFADRVEIITDPHTDLWQRTYYHFCNDNAYLGLYFLVLSCQNAHGHLMTVKSLIINIDALP